MSLGRMGIGIGVMLVTVCCAKQQPEAPAVSKEAQELKSLLADLESSNPTAVGLPLDEAWEPPSLEGLNLAPPRPVNMGSASPAGAGRLAPLAGSARPQQSKSILPAAGGGKDMNPQERVRKVRLACAGLYALCDGRTARTDVCVRDISACAEPLPWASGGEWPCCPTACVEAYMRARRRSVPVAEAGRVFTEREHQCYQALLALPAEAGAKGAAGPPPR